MGLGRLDKLQGDKLEPALLKASDDLADESALDAIGLESVVLVASWGRGDGG